MKTPAAPTPPDPVATARAQAQTNKETATTQQQLNMVDQTNPYGTLSYQQTGRWDDGTPRFSATTTLSPEEQQKQEQQWKFDDLVNRLGISQTQKLNELLAQPVDLSNPATEGRLLELGKSRLDPIFEARRKTLEADLLNRGVGLGSEAYGKAMDQFGRDQNDAYNQLIMSGHNQAVQEALTARNQPINEITALMSGGQVQQPSFGSTPTTNVANTDLAGLTMDAYKLGPYAQWQADVANKQAMMGGLFGLAGAGVKAAGGWRGG